MQTSSPIKKAKQNALDNFHFSQVRYWLYEGKISSEYNILVCSYYEELQSTSAMLLNLLTQPLNNIKNVYYFSYISNHRFAFWDDLSCPIYSSVIINSHTSESFICLFPELFSLAILFCFLTNLMSRFFPWQMEVNGFLFIVSLLQVRKLSPVLCHTLNWFEERHPFCSSRTLIILHSLEAIKVKASDIISAYQSKFT